MNATTLEHALLAQLLWLEQKLQNDLESVPQYDQNTGAIVNRYAAAIVPDWELRQRIWEVREAIEEAKRTQEPAL